VCSSDLPKTPKPLDSQQALEVFNDQVSCHPKFDRVARCAYTVLLPSEGDLTWLRYVAEHG